MASSLDIANLALSHIGDVAGIASLTEGSPQAAHCNRYYPIARDTLLEIHNWNFATVRVQLAQMSSNDSPWGYAYARPNDCIKVQSVIDVSGNEHPYACEVDASGQQVIYTDLPDALVKFTIRVNDAARFPPLFTLALSWHLASMIAGPIIKGDVGAAEAKRCAGMVKGFVAQSAISDSGQQKVPAAPYYWER